MLDVSDLDLLQVDLLARRASLFCSPAKRPTASDEVVPRHMKSDEGLFESLSRTQQTILT